MSWFSATVMGGDTPLDYQGDFVVDVCGINYDEWLERDSSDKFRSKLESNIDAMTKYAEDRDDEIAFQVLGVLLVESACTFSEELRQRIIKAVEDDKWAAEGDLERRVYMDNFKSLLMKYDIAGGTIAEVQYEGLFDQFAKLLNGE